MKRKIGEIFESEIYGKKYRVEKSNLSYPSKCKDCDFCTVKRKRSITTMDCKGALDETGDCRAFSRETTPTELIFKEVK